MRYLLVIGLCFFTVLSIGQPKKEYIPHDSTYYRFSENSTVSLGRGFLPNFQHSIKQSPFRFDLDTIEGRGSYLTSFEIHLLTDRKTLEEALDWDVKLDVKSRLVTSDATLKVIENTTFNDDELTFLIKAETEYGRTSIKNLKLKPEAKRLYKRTPALFIEHYGSKIPVTKRHGASVYILVTIQNVSQTRKKMINASFMLKRTTFSFSGSLTTSLNKAAYEADERKDLKISILTKGGSGLDKFSNILEKLNADNFVATIQTGIAEYFKQFSFSNSAPLGYFCASYKKLGLIKVPEEDFTNRQLLYLKNIVAKHRHAFSLLRTYQQVLDNKDVLSNFLTPEKRKELEGITEVVSKYLDELDRLYQQYLTVDPASDIDIPELPSNALNYFKGFNLEIKRAWENHSPKKELDLDNEPTDLRSDYTRKDESCQYNTYISGPYLAYVKVLGISYLDLKSSEGAVKEIRVLKSPHQGSGGVIAPYLIEVTDSTGRVNKDAIGIRCSYFKSPGFFDALNAKFTAKNEKIDIIVEAENTLGLKTRKVIMTLYKGNPVSYTSVVYKSN